MDALTAGTVFDPLFETAIGPVEAGTAFALELAGLPVLLVTCQHLFGPAGGVSKDVPPEMMPRFVQGVVGTDIVAKGTVRAGGALAIPGVDAKDPMHDLAAFVLEASPALRPLRIAAPTEEDEEVFLASRLRQGGEPGVFLHPGVHRGTSDDGTTMIIFDDPALHMPGSSGAPVVSETGALVGMVVRFRKGEGVVAGFLLPAAEIERALRATPLPKPKGGFFKRLFG